MYKALHAALITTAVIAVPVSFTVMSRAPSTSQAAQAAVKSTPTKTPVHARPTPTVKARTAPVTTRTYVGPSVNMQWGPVQVTIVVKGSAVTSISATAPTERARSAFINNQALPMLRQEVLQAKTAANIKNIYAISGATMTSQAYYDSLLAALHTAHLA